MTIKIGLDTDALSSLIKSDPNFQAEIQSAVLTNIAKRYVKGVSIDIQNAVENAAILEKNNVVKEYGKYDGNSWNSKFTLNSSITNQIKRSVGEIVEKELTTLIKQIINETVAHQKAYLSTAINREIQSYSNTVIAEEVKTKITEALAKIKF
jgi:hypothetical protein